MVLPLPLGPDSLPSRAALELATASFSVSVDQFVITYKSRMSTVTQLTGGPPNQGNLDMMIREEPSDCGSRSSGSLSQMLVQKPRALCGLHKSTFDLTPALFISFILLGPLAWQFTAMTLKYGLTSATLQGASRLPPQTGAESMIHLVLRLPAS